MKLWLKQCPRCGGDLYLEHDIFGKRMSCLQCGRSVDLVEKVELVQTKPVTVAEQLRSSREPVAPAA